MRPKAHHRVFSVKPFYEYLQRSLQVRHGDSLIHHQALDLVKEGRVGGVHRVGTVHPARGDDADGRLLFFHGADLHRGGLGAEKNVVVDIEGVLGVPGWVVLRNIERLEVIIVALHLRALNHVEAHSQENFLELVEHDGQRMLIAQFVPLARHRHVDAFCL